MSDTQNERKGERQLPEVAIVLAGGIALGAYEAGAASALMRVGRETPTWIAGASIGSVNAALIAGGPPDDAVQRLQQFWHQGASHPLVGRLPWTAPPPTGPLRRWYNRASVLQTLAFGHPGIFRPRLALGLHAGADDVSALYDLEPLRQRLETLVDFDRLNDGPLRVTLAATDVGTGERVVFDNRLGTRITARHVTASCALLPIWAPVELDGRLLADGALSSNTPLDLVLDGRDVGRELVCFVVDLFAREGHRPHHLMDAVSRAGDLTFGNQTRALLEARSREYRLRQAIGRLAERLPDEERQHPDVQAMLAETRPRPATLFHLSFRAALDEAGPMKGFDFSRASIGDRWSAGADDMGEAMRVLAGSDRGTDALTVHDVRAGIPGKRPVASFSVTAR